MPEASSPAQSKASPPTETKEPEVLDTSNATAEVRIRYTADNQAWATQDTYWPMPYITHYGASSVRLLPQYSDPKFVGENLTYLDSWAKDAQTRGLQEPTIDGYRRNLRAYAAHLGPLSILPIGVPQLTSYMDHLKATRGLVGKQLAPHVSALASLYDYLASEAIIPTNPVPAFRRRFLAVPLREAHKKRLARRQLLSVDHMRLLVHSISDLRDRCILVILVKTGVRSGELVAIDVGDIDWKNQSITLKPFPKRTNTLVFFDDETEFLLKTWLAIRKTWLDDPNGPLFVAETGRLPKAKVGHIISRAARRLGLHNPKGDLKARFTPHACRHWFSTHLRRAGMEAEFIQFMRGDSPGRTLDTYLHIDWEEVRHDYLKRIPQLGLRESQPPQVWNAIATRVEAAKLKLPELGPAEPITKTPILSAVATPPPAVAPRIQETEEPAPFEAIPDLIEPEAERGNTQPETPPPVPDPKSGFKAQRNGPNAGESTMLLRKALRRDKKAGSLRPRAEYLSLLGVGRSRSTNAANLILVREAKRILGRPLGRNHPTKLEELPRKARKGRQQRAAPMNDHEAPSRPPGRQPGRDTVKLRETLQADQASDTLQPRAAYLAILGAGKSRTKHAANFILNREAKRILGRPFGADPAPVAVAPVVVRKRGRKPSPPTVVLRERLQADVGGGKVRDASHYVRWLVAKPKLKVKAEQVRPLVWRELRLVRMLLS
jgi:site-specific recombinase XerD